MTSPHIPKHIEQVKADQAVSIIEKAIVSEDIYKNVKVDFYETKYIPEYQLFALQIKFSMHHKKWFTSMVMKADQTPNDIATEILKCISNLIKNIGNADKPQNHKGEKK